jgi:hypothetical protein
MGLTLKSTPLRVKLIGKQQCVAGIVPSGEFTVIALFMARAGILCVLMKACEMNVCEAPKSKRTVPGVEWTSNIPIITLGSSIVVPADT